MNIHIDKWNKQIFRNVSQYSRCIMNVMLHINRQNVAYPMTEGQRDKHL